jgi:predicted RNA-binding Zn ribbon-like protein
MVGTATSGEGLPYGVLQSSPTGPRFSFDAGALCLQFAVTGGEDERARWETLHRPDDLRRWLATCPLAVDEIALSPADVVAARRLREAIWQVALRLAHDEAPRPPDMAVVNELAAEPPLVPVLGPDLRSTWRSPVTAAQVLSTLARDAIALFTGPSAGRIRQCSGNRCGLLFVDTSRPGKRRWCSMQRCGNLHKQRNFRGRDRDRQG